MDIDGEIFTCADDACFFQIFHGILIIVRLQKIKIEL